MLDSRTLPPVSMMKIPLRAGRIFRDSGETEQVVVISTSAAQQMWPGQNPVGRRVRKSNEAGDDYSRVSVVGDVLSSGLERAPTRVVYRPIAARHWNTGVVGHPGHCPSGHAGRSPARRFPA
jgi:hypothetical protein